MSSNGKNEKYVGRPVKRTEDPRLIQGLGHYVDDIRLAGELYVAFLRSPYAHARINSINTDAARNASGVVAIFTGSDIEGRVGNVPTAAALEGLKVPKYPVLALGKVFFVGQPVAAVIATSRYAARDAVDLIEVDFEPLDVVVDAEAAAQGGPVIHHDFGDNIAYVHRAGIGDVDAAFASADKIVAQKMHHQRLAPISLEPRGVLASFLPGEQQLTLWTSTQIPHLLRTQVAIMIGLPENKVRVIAPEVGGGFGSKLNVYAEEALLSFISMQLHKPVKWIETRRENMSATIHGRAQSGVAELALKNDGTILGLRYTVTADLGAYHQLLTPAIPTLTGLMLSGCYKIPAISMVCTGVFTNKMATDAYRGAGRPEATYVVERLMDIAAQELGIDPVELRRKNFPTPDEFPFATATGLFYDSGNYQAALDRALAMVDYDKLREIQKSDTAAGRLVGIGVSTYVEICALGPSAAMPAGGWESATVRIEPTGKVTVMTGASPHGQGQETSFAQITADMLGVDLNDVYVIHGDTGIVQYGIGTFGSRATAVGGTAVVYATEKLISKATKIAAHLLTTDEENVTFENGVFSGASDDKQVTIQQVALAAHLASNLPPDTEPGLSATYFFEPKNFTFPFGAHICIVEVDRDTGDIRIKRYVAVDDCGKVINPLLVEGQVHGGIAQGLGQALFEEVVYDENGQLITGTLMDYAVPKAHQLPRYELDRTETPTDVNPLGVKGVGEAGTIGSTPAIVNAVIDALRPFGVKHIDMPLRPEKIWRVISNQ
ncbi:MAG: xanthine dehydrogenase family protein molybdopterin-binding subunit [Blastocatellales bacterium]|nr:xanthine dehydrogenase family protein molybdopterin-binding subunit [Blastocatellales bacterium]